MSARVIMIVIRAPLGICFVEESLRGVISATIDKYIYITINRTPLIPKISARYNISETVDSARLLRHTRIKAALVDLRIDKGIEIASFGDLPETTGLGSSSSFSVALIKGLYSYLGKKLDPIETAELASRLEIDLLGKPVGKQNQYAASFGGLNIIEFTRGGRVNIKPILIDYRKRIAFENHLFLLFTGVIRKAPSLKKLSDSVDEFSNKLIAGDFKGLGQMLHEAWLQKSALKKTISTDPLEELYSVGLKNGAWGGKILGAGRGGCLLFIAPPAKIQQIKKKLHQRAAQIKLNDYKEIPFRFVQSGAEILFNADNK